MQIEPTIHALPIRLSLAHLTKLSLRVCSPVDPVGCRRPCRETFLYDGANVRAQCPSAEVRYLLLLVSNHLLRQHHESL